MFGFVAADAGALSEEEKERYRAVYCGLCLALRDRYGLTKMTKVVVGGMTRAESSMVSCPPSWMEPGA